MVTSLPLLKKFLSPCRPDQIKPIVGDSSPSQAQQEAAARGSVSGEEEDEDEEDEENDEDAVSSKQQHLTSQCQNFVLNRLARMDSRVAPCQTQETRMKWVYVPRLGFRLSQ